MSELTWRVTHKWTIKDWSGKRGRERLRLETVPVNGHSW
jgi:hypothetical protein